MEEIIVQRLSLKEAEKEFLSKYPSANIKKLMQFYLNHLPCQNEQELEFLFPSVEFFERLLELYNQKKLGKSKIIFLCCK